MRFVVVGAALALPAAASAACEKEVTALGAAQGPDVGAAFTALARCDGAQATAQFAAAVKKTGDVEALTALAQAAIDAGITAPVYGMLEQIPDYAAREETARLLGARCGDDPAVLAFVNGAHAALKDRAFVGWAGALRTCPADALTTSLEGLAAQVPSNAFDDKYATVVDLYATRKRAAALPVLEAAAIGAAKGGPFPVVVDAMVKAVTPEGFGAKPSGADRDALVASLQKVAGAATPDQVTRLADVFVNVGAADAAASLLPRIYPDRVQGDGSFLYGVAAVEVCDGAAVVHYATVTEPGKRWSITADVEGPARAFKPKLKCTDPWAVHTTPGPVKTGDEVDAWAQTVADGTKIADAKLKEEGAIALK